MLLGLMVEHRAFLCCATHQASSRHSRSSGPQKATTFAESTCTSTRCAVFDHPLVKRHVLHKTQPNSKLLAPPHCDCALYDSRATRAYSPHVWAPFCNRFVRLRAPLYVETSIFAPGLRTLNAPDSAPGFRRFSAFSSPVLERPARLMSAERRARSNSTE